MERSAVQDTTKKTRPVTFIVPFEYKQSTLYHANTFTLMDSVAEILKRDSSITLSIFGYSYFTEGNDYVCYWLSYNRAHVVKTYVIGRGVDSSRIIEVVAKGKDRSIELYRKSVMLDFHSTAEMVLNIPIPPPPVVIIDQDDDGIPDTDDGCPIDYGYPERNGCPDSSIIVPFEPGQSSLFSSTYHVLDSVITVLRKDRSISLYIRGYAYSEEGVETLNERLARERADITRRYLLSRRIAASRIKEAKGFGTVKQINAGRNPQEKARNSRSEIFLSRE